MKFEVVIVMAIGWFVLRAIFKAMKSNKANAQRGGQNSNNSANTGDVFLDEAVQRLKANLNTSPTTRHFLDEPAPNNNASVTDSFYVPKPKVTERSNHYDEGQLVVSYEERHAIGKTLEHHKHKLFDESKDRGKASRHNLSGGKASSARTQTANTPVKKRAERRKNEKHPFAESLRNKAGLKNAIILSEILNRPEY